MPTGNNSNNKSKIKTVRYGNFFAFFGEKNPHRRFRVPLLCFIFSTDRLLILSYQKREQNSWQKPNFILCTFLRNGNKIKVEFARDELTAQTSQIFGLIWVIMPKIWRRISLNSQRKSTFILCTFLNASCRPKNLLWHLIIQQQK